MEHPQIREVAVCGVDDLTWGQKVAAVVSLEDSAQTLTLEEVFFVY
jgi:acyl-CoA synthetase (AMP-forming)/AMP-acid ligase II